MLELPEDPEISKIAFNSQLEINAESSRFQGNP